MARAVVPVNANPLLGRRTGSVAAVWRVVQLTPQELADLLGAAHPDIFQRIELRCDMRVSTLRRHVETTGGRLVLIAEFPGRRERGELSIDQVEWEHIQRVLREHDNNISATARALAMHRRTLQRKLQKHPRRSS